MTSRRPTRQQLGQWFTPEPVADLALSLALEGTASPHVLMDPSCGDGVFLRGAERRGVAANHLYGVDIDELAIAEARSHVPRATLINGDFFDAEALNLPRADLIVGNPPYVRQERVGADAKEAIVASVLRAQPQLGKLAVRALVGRSDLAAPFVLRLLGQLRETGVAALVLSSAFFDAGYGAEFWALAETVSSLRLVVDAPKERWFAEAAIHAVIAVFDAKPSSKPVRLARLSCGTRQAAARLAKGASLADIATLREAERNLPHTWAAALRAPDAWLSFAAEAGDALVPLGELAEVRRGITSGANEIFYVSRAQATEWKLDSQFLQPLLTARGRSGQGTIAVGADDLEQFALVIPRTCNLAEHPALAGYFERFSGAASRGTLRNRKPWWSLRAHPGHVFLCKAYAERFVQPYSAFPMVADQRMYSLSPHDGPNMVTPQLLAALLNATCTSLALESLGRASMGQGALEWTVADVAKLPVIDIRKHPEHEAIVAAFEPLARRPVRNVAAEAGMLDRRALDAAILGPWPRLVAMLESIADALVVACGARQARAKAGLL